MRHPDHSRITGLVASLALLVAPCAGLGATREEALSPPNAALSLPARLVAGLGLEVEGNVKDWAEGSPLPGCQAAGAWALQARSWSGSVRVHPFGAAFYLGAVMGAYDLTASRSTGTGSPAATLHVSGLYLGPQIGWKWAWDFGLFVGMNFGYGFPVGYQSALVQPDDGGSSGLDGAKRDADRNLGPGVPVATLLELGWRF